jgi:RNA polymerase sigma-70 factor (ECF subfamily)
MTQSTPDVMSHPDENPTLDSAIQAHLGSQLRALYGDPEAEKLPHSLAQLAARVAQVIRAHTEPVDQAFIDGIMGSLSSLRSFAISLSRDVHRAEDLVQDTVLKAISKQERFEAGTNMQAWLFTILRNLYFSAHRKTRREVEDADGSHAATMITIPDQEDRIVVQDLEAALAKLPQEQREAILLVGAEGMAYEEAAEALGVKVGTVKSRVNRARNRLAEMMGLSGGDGIAGSRGAAPENPA